MTKAQYQGSLTTILGILDPFAQTFNRKWSIFHIRSLAQAVEYFAGGALYIFKEIQ